MKIYVASSWRNEERQQRAVRALRATGHDVYDFRNADGAFSWRECASPEQLRDPRAFRDEVLTHPVARAGFAKDMGALAGADATVLVLPCGRSAHLELGWAAGHGQRTLVWLDDPMSEPELMYLACSDLCVTLEGVVSRLSSPAHPIWQGDECQTKRVGDVRQARIAEIRSE